VVACAAGAGASELRGISVRPAPDGQTMLLELSQPAETHVSVVRGRGQSLARLYIDLPAGSRVAAGTKRTVAGERPVTAARIGQGDDGNLRIVLELDGAQSYRVRRERQGRVVAVTVTRAVVEAAAEAPAVPPASEPTPRIAVARPVVPVGPARRETARPKIVLDPGHGGNDPGAMGFVVEKEFTLDIALRIERLLRDRLDADVVLTRGDDATLTLPSRTGRANTEGADLFVSIHANANDTGRLQGVETYYLDNTVDQATLRLASLENGLDMLKPAEGGADLRYILSDLVQGGKIEESAALAQSIQSGLVRNLRLQWPGVVDLGVKRGPFYVLVGAYMPCVLVETSFLSHPVEGRRMADPEYRAAVAEGVYGGIARFLASGLGAKTL
jgi:N-acetylmuramoyl-L-alanine amidase